MKVLIIDDNELVRQTLRGAIQEGNNWEVRDQGFQDLQGTLLRFRPDAVVLDLVEGDVTEDVAGNDSFDEIRSSWFCPVVVYSDYQGEQNFKHALVKTIPKGPDSDLAVVQSLQGFTAMAQVIRDVHWEFDKRIREALRDFTPLLREQAGSTANLGDDPVLPRAVRRLVAARMDADASGGASLKAWERLVVPALGGHLLSADLLRRKDAGWNKPDAFRLVLTPSCDLVRHGGGDPKAERVLVAQCEAITELANVKIVPGTPLTPRQQKKVRSTLTEGIAEGLLPIPRFTGHVPSMAANLRRLQLIQPNDIRLGTGADHAAADKAKFVRAASTDSPFREVVMWSYLRVAGRPGAPVFDVDGWLNDITAPEGGTGEP